MRSCAATRDVSSSSRSRRPAPTRGPTPTRRARTIASSDRYSGGLNSVGRAAGEHVESRVSDDQHAQRGARSRAQHHRHPRGDQEPPAGRGALPPRLRVLHARADVRRRDAYRCTRTRAWSTKRCATRRRPCTRAILADLDTAIATLPVTQTDVGRATKGAAQALRSKVYLTRAYRDYSPNKQGDFQAALADAKAVIASGTYSLNPVYADLWCVARPRIRGAQGYCENTGYNGESDRIHLHRAVLVRPDALRRRATSTTICTSSTSASMTTPRSVSAFRVT